MTEADPPSTQDTNSIDRPNLNILVTFEDAKKLADKGFSVIPIKAREKVPSVSSWREFQQRKPTEEELYAWFNPGDKNIGIICGRVSKNLVVFDFDDQEAMSFVVPDINETAKKTMVVRTGKGFHVYYRVKTPQNFKLINLKIDVKGEGGYVIAPPSVHPSGIKYLSLGTTNIAEVSDEIISLMKEADEMYPLAKVASNEWGGGNRHELALGLASFFRTRGKWSADKVQRFIRGVMRLKGDREEVDDRMRAIEDAFKKEYPYNKHLKRELVEQLLTLLPVGSGEIWRYYDRGDQDSDYWTAYMCNVEGTFRIYHKKSDKDGVESVTETMDTIFTQPLILADAWHAEGDEENRIKFTYYLGKMKYQGTKTEVYDQIVESGLTGINRNFIRDVIAACVEYYVSSGTINVRQSYEAIGAYETDGKLELAMGDRDISATRGTEPWYVLRNYRPYSGNLQEDLKVFREINNYFSPRLLVVMFGFSAVAPFSYSLKADGDFFWPLIILKGPKNTGKTTLGRLFTRFLYGMPEGGPSDVTSDFRLLDFITGTTFPRLTDESENAKFEGQKFSIKISTTLKDAAQKQFVGNRGNLDKTKKIYAARTPLILAGNKIDVEDSALLTRTIIINSGQQDKIGNEKRDTFKFDILSKLGKGFGIELAKFIIGKYGTVKGILNDIRSIKVPYSFIDPRRGDFYSSIYLGLKLWDEFYNLNGIEFPLRSYLDMNKFKDIVSGLEGANEEESTERQSIQEFIEWMKKEAMVLQSYYDILTKEKDPPARYYDLREMVKLDTVYGKQWLYVTQAGLTEYCRVNTTFQSRSLGEVADALSEYYGIERSQLYDKKNKWVGDRAMKVVKIPLEQARLDSYENKKQEPPEPPPLTPPSDPPPQNMTNMTRPDQAPVMPENSDNTPSAGIPDHLTGKNIYMRGELNSESPRENDKKSGHVVMNDSKNENSSVNNNMTNNMTRHDHWSGVNQKYYDWNYFRVTDTFDSYLFGKKKRHMKGHVIKFPVIEAPKYIEKGFLAPACPLGYTWDELEKMCVEIQGSEKNGNDR